MVPEKFPKTLKLVEHILIITFISLFVVINEITKNCVF